MYNKTVVGEDKIDFDNQCFKDFKLVLSFEGCVIQSTISDPIQSLYLPAAIEEGEVGPFSFIFNSFL